MEKNNLIRARVMDVIADDYENLEMIDSEVKKWASESDVSIVGGEIEKTLFNLIDSGLAAAYKLYPSKQSPEEIRGRPDPSIIAECYFLLTDRGQAALKQNKE